MERAFKFLKSTSVNCGTVAEGEGVAAEVKDGLLLSGEGAGEALDDCVVSMR
jgi:hypothetical protein